MSTFSELRTSGPRCAAVMLTAIVMLTGGTSARASDEPFGVMSVGAPGTEPPDHAKPAGEAAHASDERPAGAPGRAQKGVMSLLRCWQSGQMIFEGRGYGPLPESQVAVELKQGNGTAGRVQVLGLYQGLCILELPK